MRLCRMADKDSQNNTTKSQPPVQQTVKNEVCIHTYLCIQKLRLCLLSHIRDALYCDIKLLNKKG